ncbi:MAG: acyltransferase family protein [Prevotellaceae bacterium]|jgi:fucose 4-O-acetylase-like acetyltransferase|nr:acyltransferase family protein [Prevotellaceae bacterium]
MKEKNRQFLLLQAVAIILVLIGHKGSVCLATITHYLPIHAYHMALFIFISGYFFSLDSLNNVQQYINKKVKHLLIPYFVYNLIYGVIVFILKKNNIITYGWDLNLRTFFLEPWIRGHQYIFNLAMWFVLSLFLTQLTYLFFRRLCKKIKFTNEFLMLVFLLIIGMLTLKAIQTFETNNEFLKYTCARTLFFLPFFHFGFYYKNILEKKDNLNTFIYFAILIAIIEQMKLLGVPIDYGSVFMDFHGNIFIPYIAAFTGILLWLRITKILAKYIGKFKVVEWIGSSTWDIMAHHLFVFFLINFAFYLSNYHGFNKQEFHNSIWYTFTPGSKYQTYIYYALAIAIPVGIHYLLVKIKKTDFKKFTKSKKNCNFAP